MGRALFTPYLGRYLSLSSPYLCPYLCPFLCRFAGATDCAVPLLFEYFPGALWATRYVPLLPFTAASLLPVSLPIPSWQEEMDAQHREMERAVAAASAQLGVKDAEVSRLMAALAEAQDRAARAEQVESPPICPYLGHYLSLSRPLSVLI